MRKEPLSLPDAEGAPVTLNEKVYVPVKEHPDVSRLYIFVGVFHFSLKILIDITIKIYFSVKTLKSILLVVVNIGFKFNLKCPIELLVLNVYSI